MWQDDQWSDSKPFVDDQLEYDISYGFSKDIARVKRGVIKS